ncbi:TetR family transcriptional regulator C-terminal domain-containing protein, partial [Streptomyces sp. NPDC004129]
YGAQKNCQLLNSACVDAFVEQQVLAALTPAAVEVSLHAADQVLAERAELERLWSLRLERAAQDADRARRSHHLAEPENRLVVRQLEKEWEDALAAEQRLQEDYDRFTRSSPRTLTSAEPDIARACGTSSGAVHYYFPTKQDVLSAALLHCVESAFERQSAELKAVDSAHERLLKLIDMQLPARGRVRDEWLVWLQFWAETALRPELRTIHNDFYARWRETVVRIIRRGQRQGQFRADADAEQLALGITALTDGLAIQVLTEAPQVTADRMRGVLLDFIERELLARTGGSLDSADA